MENITKQWIIEIVVNKICDDFNVFFDCFNRYIASLKSSFAF